MTLSERNSFFKIGIIFCAAVILFMIIVSFLTIPLYQGTDYNQSLGIDENTRRPNYFFQYITGLFLGNNYYAVHVSLLLAGLFSFVGMLLIHFYFERTPAPEILYISFFTLSFSFEAFRLILPLQLIFTFPALYLGLSARIILFARFCSIFSLFTAGLCAAGLKVQKFLSAIFVIIVVSLVITIGVPIDVFSWDTGFNLINGYSTMFKMIELVVFVSTALSFLIAAKVRGSKEYVYIAAGIVLALSGRNIFLGTDNWIGLVLGIFLLSFGTLYLCSKVHKINLWL
jgi:hypothetical protein